MLPESDSSRTRILPVELLADIFDYLLADSSHNRSVHNCRQVCKQFNEILLSLLFTVQGLEVGYAPPIPPCAYLNRTGITNALALYPELGQRIHHISFRVPSSDSLDYVAHDAWLEASPLLHLQNIHSLTIDIRDSCYGFSEFSGRGTLSASYRKLLKCYLPTGVLTSLSICGVRSIPILDIFTSPSLVNLKFDDCSFVVHGSPSSSTTIARASNLVSLKAYLFNFRAFPMPVLQYLPRLKTVELSAADMYTPPATHRNCPTASSTPHTFRYLSEITTPRLQTWNPFLPARIANIDNSTSPFPVLKKLACRVCSETNVSEDMPILDHIKSLKELSLNDIGKRGRYGHGSLHLEDYIFKYKDTLEVLSFQWQLRRIVNPETFGYPLDQINTALERIAGRNILETINFSLMIDLLHAPTPFSPRLTNIVWLANILCRPLAFPRLRKVNMQARVLVHDDTFEGPEKTHAMLHSMIASDNLDLYASRSIDFTFTTEYDVDPDCPKCEIEDENRQYYWDVAESD